MGKGMLHEEYMREALQLATEAAQAGEVPVGCVIVRDGAIIARGRNRCEERRCATAHAEIEAITQAGARCNDWRLEDCTLYVTMEPCPMCAGAVLNARIPRLYYGTRDSVCGACGGLFNLFMEDVPKRTAITGGILEEDCRDVLRSFFQKRRID